MTFLWRSGLVAAALFGFVTIPKPADAQTTLIFDQTTGLFTVRHHTIDLVKPAFVFWHDDWVWSGVDVRGKALGQGQYTLSGTSEPTGLTISGNAVQTAPNQLIWKMTVSRSADRSVNDWGGISFQLNTTAETSQISPKLLPGNEGWELELEAGRPPLQITFSPPPASVHFERGNTHEIRVYFNDAGKPPPTAQFTMKVTLPPGGLVELSTEERVAPPDPSTWYSNLTLWNRSPVDLSFLNEPERPAGKRGFLQTRNGKLAFEDGHTIRFWGTNLTAAALFGTDFGNIRVQARRLSELGFNLVRIHHHDSLWVDPNVFGSKSPNTRSLDLQSLRTLDWWIKCLKEEGIYIWLDLEVGRSFTAADDIDAFSEIAKGEPTGLGKGFSYVNESIQSRMKEFASAYLTHFNTFTGLSYKDDPAIAFVLLTNENDLTHHFGNWLLPIQKVPHHSGIYMGEAAGFALRHGLNPDMTWRSWEYGPSKIFLNDLEHRFNAEMIAHLRGLGVRVPIATTNSWGGMTLAGLPSLTDGDVIDVHSYDEPNFLQTDPHYRSNLLQWMSAASVFGKPLTISEWNVSPFPAADRSALPTYVASIASLQGWDALMAYAYSVGSLDGPAMPGNWEFANDPSLLAMMPAAALLYRRADVSEGTYTVLLSPDSQTLMGQPLSPATSRAIRTLTEQTRLRILLPEIKELPWLEPLKAPQGVKIVNDLGSNFVAQSQSRLCADTGEFCRDWQAGVFTVQTPRSELAAGWIGGKKIDLKNTTLLIDTANAAIAVQSLDGLPISRSRHIMISMAAQSVPRPLLDKAILSEPVLGYLKLRATEGLRAYRLGADGSKQPISTQFEGGTYTIHLNQNLGSYWLLLEEGATN